MRTTLTPSVSLSYLLFDFGARSGNVNAARETAFAMSVHKAQGSEFDEVLLLLGDRPSPLLTRELVYTAVTRARRRVRIFASREILVAAVAARVERASGLRERLWGVE